MTTEEFREIWEKETGLDNRNHPEDFAEAYHKAELGSIIKKEMDRIWEIIPDAHKENPTDKELINLGRFLALEELEELFKNK